MVNGKPAIRFREQNVADEKRVAERLGELHIPVVREVYPTAQTQFSQAQFILWRVDSE